MTVYGMLHEHNIPKGEFLLQTAATSVLGRQMISLAKHYGVHTINVVRRNEAVEELKSIGYGTRPVALPAYYHSLSLPQELEHDAPALIADYRGLKLSSKHSPRRLADSRG